MSNCYWLLSEVVGFSMATCASDCDDELDSVLLQASLQYDAAIETAGDTDGSGKPRDSRLACETCLDASETNQDDLDGDDDSLDGVLLEASLQFEENNLGGTGNGQGKENISGRFPIVSDADIEKDVSMSIPAKTRKQTNWCHNVWLAWRESRIKQSLEYPPVLLDMSDEELCKWLGKFLYEARMQDGSEYGGESLYQLFCGIQRFLRMNGRPDIDFLTDTKFRILKNTLDARMKSLTRAGVGVERNRSEPISVDEEEMLWSKGMLGDSSPDILRDTMVYMCGLYFALRGGMELRQLTRKQLSIHELSNGDRYIQYQEMGSKNNPGGIHHRKVVNKVVPHYEIKKTLHDALSVCMSCMCRNALQIHQGNHFSYIR